MIWLIGGSARCGKSTLARKVQGLYGGQIFSLDYLVRALIPVASEASLRDLRTSARIDDKTIPQWIDALRQRDRVLWEATKGLLEAAHHSQHHVFLEGGLWPDLVSEVLPDPNIGAIYLVDTSPSHAGRIVELAHNSSAENNWMSDWDDERLTKWASYNVARSKLISKLAAEHDQPVFDAAEGLDASQQRALDYLARALG